MATVYEAEHTVLGVHRALKVFSVDEGRQVCAHFRFVIGPDLVDEWQTRNGKK